MKTKIASVLLVVGMLVTVAATRPSALRHNAAQKSAKADVIVLTVLRLAPDELFPFVSDFVFIQDQQLMPACYELFRAPGVTGTNFAYTGHDFCPLTNHFDIYGFNGEGRYRLEPKP